jgi:hypothetical protein
VVAPCLALRTLRWRWWASLALGAFAGVAGAGCITLPETARIHVIDRAIRDLQCPRNMVLVKQELTGRFQAIGCGKKKGYTASCEGLQCVVFSDDEGLSPWRDRPDPLITRPP